MKFLVPIPRPDVVEAFTPLLEEMVKRDHRVTVVTSWPLEQKYRLSGMVQEVRISDPYSKGKALWEKRVREGKATIAGKFAAALMDVADTVEKYFLASELLYDGVTLLTYSNDAVQVRPFIDVAVYRKRRIATIQMTFMYANAQNMKIEQDRIWRSTPVINKMYGKFVQWTVAALTGVPAYFGPRRIWGTSACALYVIDEQQKAVFAKAGIPEEKIRVTGAPFLDMIYQRVKGFDDTRLLDLRRNLGISDNSRLMLVASKNIASIVKDEHPPQEVFVRKVANILVTEMPGWQLFFKLHPTEDLHEYQQFLKEISDSIVISKDMNIVDALMISDGMLSFGISSPCYYARLLGLPQVIYRFKGYCLDEGHLPNFADIPIAYEEDELINAVECIVKSRPNAQPSVVTKEFDGHASERIALNLEQLDKDRSRIMCG